MHIELDKGVLEKILNNFYDKKNNNPHLVFFKWGLLMYIFIVGIIDIQVIFLNYPKMQR